MLKRVKFVSIPVRDQEKALQFYPKAKAFGTDLSRDLVRQTVARAGLETVAIVAVDEVWSALRCKRVR